MANPRIEEVEDDDEDDVQVGDPDEMDLDSFDFARPQHGSLQQPSSSDSILDPSTLQSILSPASSTNTPQRSTPQISERERERLANEQREKSKHFQCLYPVYFDASRSREDGRRVKKEDAVPNPLAREIVEALHHVGSTLGLTLQIVFEPSKCHPKDWANPGRVRVLVKEGGKAVSAKISNKHYLLRLVSAHLQSHPTTTESPLRLRIPGVPAPKKEELDNPPAIPRGFKMGTILPLHSPARTGGGVSENFFKDMMEEMGGQMPEGMQGMANMAGLAGGGGGGGGGGPKKIRIKQKK